MANYLVWVNVTVTNGQASYSYRLDGGPKNASTLPVKAGDHVQWNVQIIGGSPATVPYLLTFDNPNIFGTGSLSVPGGGHSSVLKVAPDLPQNSETKYTLALTGIGPPSDPVIIVDDDGLHPTLKDQADFTIHWQQPDPDHIHGVVRCTNKDGVPQSFPVTLAIGSAVLFQVDPPAAFYVNFLPDSNRGSQTPFAGYGNVQIRGQNQMDPLTVQFNSNDPFTFCFSLNPVGPCQSGSNDLKVPS